MTGIIVSEKLRESDPTLFGNVDCTSSLSEWKVLIVDDDEDVHRITKLSMLGVKYNNLKINFLSAYSGAEACDILCRENDIGLVILDVVMETDHSGLDVAKYIRETLHNNLIRIVLRTGQPGQAPEDEILSTYDIDDYRDKTDLSAQKLRTLIRCNLNSYRDKRDLCCHTQQIIQINDISHGLTSFSELKDGACYVYRKMYSIINKAELPEDHPLTGCIFSYIKAGNDISTISDYVSGITVGDISKLDPIIIKTIDAKRGMVGEQSMTTLCLNDFHGLVFYFNTENSQNYTYNQTISELLQDTLSNNYRNLYLNDLINRNQREIMYRICEVVETRSKESGVHVKRVSAYCAYLAKLYGMSDKDVELLKKAAPLHDLGKIAMPDSILHKPGKLDEYEWTVMKTHAQIGYEMLKDSEIDLFNVAAEIAFYHHEKWDGTGYPNGIAGNNIPLNGRITAIADVFDALASDRCYKKKWPLDKIYALFVEERGKHFDPKLTDIFIEHFDEFVAIKNKFDES